MSIMEKFKARIKEQKQIKKQADAEIKRVNKQMKEQNKPRFIVIIAVDNLGVHKNDHYFMTPVHHRNSFDEVSAEKLIKSDLYHFTEDNKNKIVKQLKTNTMNHPRIFTVKDFSGQIKADHDKGTKKKSK